ncbi:DUF86 domain-containing protein [Desulfobacterales bacterium HSG16]|nr:DUF86 domain-containing protein [Desulfobacterales bacterium HSG16]
MIDTHLIERKLRKIETFLMEIETADAPPGFDSFSDNIVFKRFVERNIELSIEQMIDICKHLVSGLGLREPETYAECFEIIGKAGVVARQDANIFKAMARYRNLLIHGYDGVDDKITYKIYSKNLKDFKLFVNSIRGYIQRYK